MIVSQRFFCGLQDVNAENDLSDTAMLEALSNTANMHGLRIGQSAANDIAHKWGWVVLNWKLQVKRRPHMCEPYTVRTWARDYSRAFALRDFDLLDKDGTVFAWATSKWAIIDMEKRTHVRLTPDIMESFGLERDRHAFEGEVKFARVKLPQAQEAREAAPEGERQVAFKVCRHMIDCNGHVHNTAYLDMAQEVVPEEILRLGSKSLEVAYRKEVDPGATVLLRYFPHDGVPCVAVCDESGETIHATILYG